MIPENDCAGILAGMRGAGTSVTHSDAQHSLDDLALEVSRVPNPAIVLLDPVVAIVRNDSNNNGDVRRGLPPRHKPGRSSVYRVADVQAWMARRAVRR